MKRILCCTGFLLISLLAFNQRLYFIYLESESQKPFSVKVGEKIQSAANGYLIISNLHDSTYSLSVGFPGDQWPAQRFTIAMKAKDHGFLLKNFGEKGWGLFDLQTLSVQMAEENNSPSSASRLPVSAFTAILAKASNDPSLLERPALLAKAGEKSTGVQPAVVREVVEPEKKNVRSDKTLAESERPMKDTGLAFAKPNGAANSDIASEEGLKKDSAVALMDNPVAGSGKIDAEKDSGLVAASTSKPMPGNNNNAVAETGEKSHLTLASAGSTGKQPAGVKQLPDENASAAISGATLQADSSGNLTARKDNTGKKSDAPIETVSITRPDAVNVHTGNNTLSVYKRSNVRKKSESSTTEGFGLVFIDELGKGERDTIQILIPNTFIARQAANQSGNRGQFLDIRSDDKDLSRVKPDVLRACQSYASESDFYKLRKKMASQKSDDAMINESRKVFKSKCFTTDQVRNLGNLFLNEAAKFQFYEAAYPFSSDRANFAALEGEFRDAYFIHRFKKLVN